MTKLQAGEVSAPLEEVIVGDIADRQSNKEYVIQRALLIQKYLTNKNFANIIIFIHPIKGVLFSMYAYVKPKNDKEFTREQFAKYWIKDKIKFTLRAHPKFCVTAI